LAALSKMDQDFIRETLGRETRERGNRPPRPGDVRYGPPRKLCDLQSPAVRESSGLACSRRTPGLFWTHNDAGSQPNIYLFDRAGRDLGSCRVAGIDAFDWEDMSIFTEYGKHYLLLADTGNNGLNSAVQMLHVIEEPPADPKRGVLAKEVPVLQTIYLAYEDDFRDCEAVAVDPTDKTIVLVSKERSATCHAYALPWPKEKSKAVHRAKAIATLRLRQVTSLDISPDGRRAIALTYGNAYEYVRGDKETWATAFARPPRELAMPPRKQGESICFGLDGKTLYLTSEKVPTPLWEVPAVEEKK
jgi:hypothetical protein